jgi:uncharacterized tellurite resistance protein B-like protein
MIAELLKRLDARLSGSSSSTGSALAATDLERVAAVLLVEIARSDQSIDEVELKAISDAIVSASSLRREEVDELVAEAVADADAAISLHAHLRFVNDNLDPQARAKLVENMWRVALADGDIDRYEEHRIRSLSDLLYLKHRDFMQAKHRALEAHSGTS